MFFPRREWNPIESTQSNPNLQAWCFGTNTFHDRCEIACPVFKTPTVLSVPRPGAQKLVAEISVTMLYIHEMKSGALRQHSCLYKVIH